METSQHPKRIHLLISGKVQGVYYRSSACEKARVLGLCGTVRNLPSGQVELVAEGEESALQRLIAWCQMGPPAAEVSAVDVRWTGARRRARAAESRLRRSTIDIAPSTAGPRIFGPRVAVSRLSV